MRALHHPLLAGLLGVALGLGCSVTFSDSLKYTCTRAEDCAGDGLVCTAPAGGAGYCCKPTGPEVCNGLDDDCNGLIDDGFPAEICNGKDDNCNGKVDEGFNLQTDPANCGACGHVCTQYQSCQLGSCITRAESDCSDGVDNDMNGKTDCADPTCNMTSCGLGCLCQALRKTERNCVDLTDNDEDGLTDCEDSDCVGAGCGDGCFCGDGRKKESKCFDGVDNDGDGKTDCADPDCAGLNCQASPSTFTCASQTCLCNGGAVVAENGDLCRDHLDNDCDGLTDCAEADCNNVSCAADGGAGCLCTGGQRTETDCADRHDNDDDGNTDCADSDCATGTACSFLNAQGQVQAGTCGANKLCQ
jgi:hypothetical protein